MILLNKAKCNTCGDEIVSRSRHDWVQCSCKAIFVDGGQEYLRRGGNLEDITELSVRIDDDATRLEQQMLSSGQVINMHVAETCYVDINHPNCPAHSPSDHRMSDWKLWWDRGFWRQCIHESFHSDPDSLDYDGSCRNLNCDGCCQ